MRLRVELIATGGTIVMAGSPARPAISAEELLAAVPQLADVAELRVRELSNVPGASLTPALAARAIAAASEAVRDGAAGAVITQGTDTIEETGELADLIWPHDEPLVITGAIRAGGSLSSDGPLNLLDSVRTACSPSTRGAGPLVVFDGTVHPAGQVVKSHTWASDAFASESPLGHVREGALRLLRPPARERAPVASPDEVAAAAPAAYIPIISAAAGMDARPLDSLREDGAAALVLVALGGGHLPPAMLPGVDRVLADGLPLVVCARPERGGTLESTYGFEGSETDLARRGVILGGHASPWKARVRLLVALGLGRPPRSLFES